MKLDRIYNSKTNIFWGIINRVIDICMPFIVRIGFVRYLGTNYLGLTNLFSSILQVLALSELGFGNAVVFSMYGAIARDDNDTLCALLLFYKKVYKIIGLMMLVFGLIIIPFLPRFINNNSPIDINIYLLYLLYLTNTVISYVLFGYKTAILNAYQRNDLLSKVQSATSIFVGVIQLLALFIFKNIYFYVAALILGSILYNLLVQLSTQKYFPNLTCKGVLPISEKKQMWIKIKGLFICKITGATRNTFDSIFLSLFLGLDITGIYSNYFYVLTSVSSIFGIVYISILSGVGNSIETETVEKNYEDFKNMDFIYMWFSCVCTACLLCLYKPFMVCFFGTGLTFPLSVEIFFCAYFYAIKMGDIRDVYSSAKGLWYEDKYRYIIESILNIFLNYVLGKYFGIYGIVGATLFTILFIGFPTGAFNCFEYYFKNNKLRSYFMFHLFYACVTIIICMISYLFCKLITDNSFIFLFVRLFICFVLSNCILFLIFRWFRSYKDARSFFIRIIRK